MLFLATLVLADDRDDDVFGTPSDPPPADTPPAEPPPTDLGEVQLVTTSDDAIAASLAEAGDRLVLGGKLYLRADAAVVDGAEFNETALSSPNLLDLFADVRPNDRVRGYAAGRFRYDFTVAPGDTDDWGNELEAGSVTLDQLWLKFDVGRVAYVTTGRQRIKWGSGRFWNPTDFLNAQALDALAATVFDERTGVTLLKVHVPLEKIGANLYAVGSFDGADDFEQVGGALRTEWVFWTAELALSAAAREGDPLRLGADLSAGLGPIDVHVESAVRHGDDSAYYEGTFNLDKFNFPEEVSREEDWIPQVVAGAEVAIKYNDRDSLYLGAEYFYNDAGYADSDLLPYLLFEGAYTPFYLGQHYAAAYLYLPSPGRWDDGSLTASTLANLSDGTYVSRLDLSHRALTHLQLNAYAAYHYGENGEFHFSYEVDPIPGMLDDGLSIPAPVAEFGVGAMVNF
ncbi:MAG: hypothetical protein FJ090_07375 [Deltaproteobacteria bacterium]|nr:hypothetical protein [Deltaproteobacteria bacterium]